MKVRVASNGLWWKVLIVKKMTWQMDESRGSFNLQPTKLLYLPIISHFLTSGATFMTPACMSQFWRFWTQMLKLDSPREAQIAEGAQLDHGSPNGLVWWEPFWRRPASLPRCHL